MIHTARERRTAPALSSAPALPSSRSGEPLAPLHRICIYRSKTKPLPYGSRVPWSSRPVPAQGRSEKTYQSSGPHIQSQTFGFLTVEGKGKAKLCGVWCLLLSMNLSKSPPVGCTLTSPGSHMANSQLWILNNPSQDHVMTPPGPSPPSSPTGQGPFLWILCPCWQNWVEVCLQPLGGPCSL